MLAPFLGLPKQSEILVIIFLGICFLSLDFSLFEIRANLKEVWNLQLNKSKNWETIFKYIISAVVLTRTFTLHAFLACYVVMLWPAIFEEKPNLMIPWLLLGILRCIVLNSITIVAGTFICNKEKGISPICLEYIAAQVIEHGPSVYAWMSVLGFYKDLASDHSSNQSSKVSLFSAKSTGIAKDKDSKEKHSDRTRDKAKSYSLSDLNSDYTSEKRLRILYANMLVDEILEDLNQLVSNKRSIQDSSKSCISIDQDKSDTFELSAIISQEDLGIKEKAMEVLKISEQDITNAQQDKNKTVKILKEVKKEDVNKIDEKPVNKITSQSFYIRKGKIRKDKSHLQESLSLHDEAEIRDSCLFYIRKQLEKEASKLTLLESEIANIQYDEMDKNTDITNVSQKEGSSSCVNFEAEPKSDLTNFLLQRKATTKNFKCVANCKTIYEDIGSNFMRNDIPNGLNRYRVVVGASLGLNKHNFLQKFIMKKNTSKNFGCQVSFLKRSFLVGSKQELSKNLAFLKNFKLL